MRSGMAVKYVGEVLEKMYEKRYCILYDIEIEDIEDPCIQLHSHSPLLPCAKARW